MKLSSLVLMKMIQNQKYIQYICGKMLVLDNLLRMQFIDIEFHKIFYKQHNIPHSICFGFIILLYSISKDLQTTRSIIHVVSGDKCMFPR